MGLVRQNNLRGAGCPGSIGNKGRRGAKPREPIKIIKEIFMKVQVIDIIPKSKKDIRYERSGVFKRENGYQPFDFALCINCAYFSFDNTKEAVEWAGKYGCGKCRLAKAMGAYDGVMATAICGKFLSHTGTDINGKSTTVRQLPDFVKLVKEEGRYSVTLTK
jgi:hypothetical protein